MNYDTEQQQSPYEPSEFSDDKFIPVPELPADLTRWQLTSDDIIEKIEHGLRGEIWNEEEKKYVARGQRLMNEIGIRSVVSVAESIINKITFLSNLDENMIFMITRELGIDLIQLIYLKHNEFEIEDEHMTLVVDKISFLIFIGLQRALLEGERKFLRTTEQRKYIVQEQPKKEKRGFWIFGKGD